MVALHPFRDDVGREREAAPVAVGDGDEPVSLRVGELQMPRQPGAVPGRPLARARRRGRFEADPVVA